MSQTRQERKEYADRLFTQRQWAAAFAEYLRICLGDAGAPAGPAQGLELKSFEPGSVIVREGDAGQSMFVLVEGIVDVMRQGEDGQPHRVDSMKKGAFFGEHALRANAPRLASVVAATRSVVLELTREHVEWMIQLNPSVEHRLRSFHEDRLLANLIRDHAPQMSA